jgi:hypothetical protein
MQVFEMKNGNTMVVLTDSEKPTDARTTICDEITRIMATYREQEASRDGVGTPGGLEHMGDVWRLLGKWDAMLRAEGKANAN